jgi:hypothetical protein
MGVVDLIWSVGGTLFFTHEAGMLKTY